MAYQLLYHPDVYHKDIAPIPRNIRVRIRKAIETRLLADPVMAGFPLRQSLKGHRKMRVGDFRVIYRVEGCDIIILKIGNRRDVYEEVFKRMRR
jgi:mRNA interferase RelE/StbE